MREDSQPNVWKGMAAGAAGGLAGALAMNQMHALLARRREPQEEPQPQEQHSDERGQPESADGGENGQDATVKAANAISRGLFHHELNEREREVAGPAVHFAMGAFSGAVYGAAAALDSRVARGAGLPFGTAVWLAADEAAVPALGLSKPPREYPPEVHAQALAAHLVYGLTTEAVRRLLLRVL